jgi:DNA-binding beta-propeller fold protein YncE
LKVSPDGKNVYVGSEWSDAVVRFNRNTTTGAISQPAGTDGCISETGAGLCGDGHGLDGPWGLAVSPDGRSIYVASYGNYGRAVARLTRDTTTGAISQPAGVAGCISEDGTGPCADGHALNAPVDVAISGDGRSVYVASATSHAVVRLNRDLSTGWIAQPPGSAGCISESGTGGDCGDGHALRRPLGVAVSPDGKSVYAAAFFASAVARFSRAP